MYNADTSGLERGMSKATSVTDTFNSALATASGMLMRDMFQSLANVAGESLKVGASLQTLTNAFEALSKSAGGNVATLEQLRVATQGTISDIGLLKSANQALMLGLPTAGLDQLFAAAIKLGHAMGIDATAAVDSLTIGIGRQSRLVLDNLGVMVNAEDAYAAYARQLGVTTNSLDENQKKLAWQEYAIAQVNKKAEQLGQVTSEAQLSQERFGAAIDNVKASLGAFLSPLAGIMPLLQPLLPMFGALGATVLPSFITGLSVAVSTMGLMGTAEVALAYATYGLSAAFTFLSSHPILLVLTAIAAALILVWNYCEPFRNAVLGLASAIGEQLGGAVAAITSGLRWLYDNILVPIATFLWNVFLVNLQGVIVAFQTLASVLAPVSDALGGAWAAISGAVSGAVVSITGDIENMVESQRLAGMTAEEISREIMVAAEAEAAAVESAKQREIEAIEEATAAALAIEQEAYDAEYAAFIEHWANMISEEKTVFEQLLSDYESYYDDKISEVEKGLSDELSILEDHHEQVCRDTKDAYDAQIDETNAFYDELLGITSEALADVRAARDSDLKHLELNYLLQKQALNELLATKAINETDYTEKMKKLDANYRDTRSKLGDEYRIKELEAEFVHKDNLIEVESERATALEIINAESESKLKSMEDKYNEAVISKKNETATKITLIENDKKDMLAAIKDQEATIVTNHNAKVTSIETEGQNKIKAIIATAESQKQNIMTISKGKIASISTAAKTEQINIWQGLVNSINGFISSISSGISGLGEYVGGAVSGIQQALGGVGEALGGIGEAVSSALGGVASILGLAEGGVVKRPTLAIIGEKEPEMVLPISKLKSFFGPDIVGVGARGGGILPPTQIIVSTPPTAIPAKTESVIFDIDVYGNTFAENVDVEKSLKNYTADVVNVLRNKGFLRI